MHFRGGTRHKLFLTTVVLCIFLSISTLMGEPAEGDTTLLFKKQFFLNESDWKGFVIEHSSHSHVENKLSWFYLKPIALDYDNTKPCDSGGSCSDEIKYSRINLPNLNGKKLVLLETEIITGPDNYIFSVWDHSSFTNYRVSIRRSDDYVGYITELLGTPFVYTPRYVKGAGHQTDNGLGADCIAVIIYGKRREGLDIPYSYRTYVEELDFSNLPYRDMPFDILRWEQ